MHHAKVSTNYPWLPHNLDPTRPVPKQYKNMPINPLGDRQAAYDAYIKGCRDANPGSRGNRCLSTEEDRIEMSLRQPQSMQNYTEIGFKKIRAPEALFSLIRDFWDKNHKNGKEEQWGSANTYTNNWEFSSEMVRRSFVALPFCSSCSSSRPIPFTTGFRGRFGPARWRQRAKAKNLGFCQRCKAVFRVSVRCSVRCFICPIDVHDLTRFVCQIIPSPDYQRMDGRRTDAVQLVWYSSIQGRSHFGSTCGYVRPHIDWLPTGVHSVPLFISSNFTFAVAADRLPLVSSAIINVAQDVDEPWPLEVYGHDGKGK
jgi:hypothetical protein